MLVGGVRVQQLRWVGEAVDSGAIVGVVIAGPVGVVVGGALGAVAGALSGVAAGKMISPKYEERRASAEGQCAWHVPE